MLYTFCAEAHINLPDNELSKVATADRKWVIVDYVIGILYSGNSRVPDNKRTEWAKIYSQYTQGGVDKIAELTREKLEGSIGSAFWMITRNR
jgi:hypothetical protein